MTDARELSWDGCVNARDLGGLGQVSLGAVVRMEAPTRLSAAGWAAAWAYGVRTVVDLRDADERARGRELLASRDTTIEASLTSTIASLKMPDFLLDNGLSDTELAALRTRLTT